LIGKPTLSTVATTGSYGDLFNKPTIPSGINDLSDVSVSTPADGQILKYNNTTHKWENAELGPNDFVCTFTADTSGEQASISCDKTVSEIKEAFLNGSNIIGKLPLYDSAIYIVFDLVQVVVQEDNVVAFVSNFGGDSISIIGTVSDNTDVWHYEETILSNVQADWEEEDTSDPAYINNKPTIPTVNNATLTIQKNSSTIDTFTANASSDKTINIVVPTSASDVSALPASTKYGTALSLSINSSTYVVTAQLKDQDGNNLGTAQTIDLPLESVVVNGSYDSTNKKIVLTLQSGSTIDVPVGDLVAGLQSEITSSNKLSADLISDGSTNKVYTATEQSKLAGIAAGAEVNVNADWNASSGDAQILNKPTIPTIIFKQW
jgi:hypothetical protein